MRTFVSVYVLIGLVFIWWVGSYHKPPYSGFTRWWEFPVAVLTWPAGLGWMAWHIYFKYLR